MAYCEYAVHQGVQFTYGTRFIISTRFVSQYLYFCASRKDKQLYFGLKFKVLILLNLKQLIILLPGILKEKFQEVLEKHVPPDA